MMSRLIAMLGLAFLAIPHSGLAQKSDTDALKLLQEIAQKYAQATRSQIESVTETRRTGPLYSSWQEVKLSVDEAPGNRYRFAGANSSGSGFVVSDGTAEWEFHEAFEEYVKRPAGSFGRPFPQIITPTDGPLRDAHALRRILGLLGNHLKTAHWKPEEKVRIGNRQIDCLVVGFGAVDWPGWDFQGSMFEETVWIDKARKLIVKTERVSDGRPGEAPHAPIQHSVETVVYPVVSLDEPIPDDVFAFSPPADAKLVSNFTDPMARYGRPAAAAQQSVPPPKLPNMIGRMEPSVTYHGMDGSSLKLDSLRGHPVLIDLWATWCGPCLEEMPLLDSIYKRTKDSGLKLIGLDLDSDGSAAVDFLKRKGYGWADYHLSADKAYGFPNTGVPLLALIDANGRFVYYHDGADDDVGLVNAIKELAPAYSAALNDVE